MRGEDLLCVVEENTTQGKGGWERRGRIHPTRLSFMSFPHLIPHKKAKPELPKVLNLKLGNILYRLNFLGCFSKC